MTGYTIRRVRRVFCALRLTVVSTAATGVLLVAGDPALAAPSGHGFEPHVAEADDATVGAA